MKCNKCKSEWSSSVRTSKCPFCGVQLSSEEPKKSETVEDVFQFILENHGKEAFQSKLLLSLLADYAPEFINERRLIKIAIESGAYNAICEAADQDKLLMYNKYANILVDTYFVGETWAKKALAWCLNAVAPNLMINFEESAQEKRQKEQAAQPNVSATQKQEENLIVSGNHEVGLLNINIPYEHAEKIFALLTSRKGKILETKGSPITPWMMIISAEISSEKMQGFDVEFNSITKGLGDFSFTNLDEADSVIDGTGSKIQGIHIDRGYISGSFVSDKQNPKIVMNDVFILMTDYEISEREEIERIVNEFNNRDIPLLVIAKDIFGEALSCILEKNNNQFRCMCIRAPGFGDRRKAMLCDLAILTGGEVITSDLGYTLQNILPYQFGRAKSVIIQSESTLIIGGVGDKTQIDARIAQIKIQIENSASDFDRVKHEWRLSNLFSEYTVERQ